MFLKFINSIIFILFLSLSLYSQNKDTVKIVNDTLEFEITIIYPGFDTWLVTQARPRGFYGLQYLESHNRFYVTEWNYRYMSSTGRFNYQFPIDYNFNTNYGYEVNYLLFNFFQYFMIQTGERMGIRRR